MVACAVHVTAGSTGAIVDIFRFCAQAVRRGIRASRNSGVRPTTSRTTVLFIAAPIPNGTHVRLNQRRRAGDEAEERPRCKSRFQGDALRRQEDWQEHPDLGLRGPKFSIARHKQRNMIVNSPLRTSGGFEPIKRLRQIGISFPIADDLVEIYRDLLALTAVHAILRA